MERDQTIQPRAFVNANDGYNQRKSCSDKSSIPVVDMTVFKEGSGSSMSTYKPSTGRPHSHNAYTGVPGY